MSIDNPLNPAQPQPMIAPGPEPSTPDIAPGQPSTPDIAPGQPSEPIITDVPMPAPPPPTPPPPGGRGATKGHSFSEKYAFPTDTRAITGDSLSKDLPLPPREGEGAGGRGGR